MSKWSVGSSIIKTLAPEIISFDNITLTFSPPDKTLTFLTPSSPANNILPRNPLTYVGSLISEYCVSQSTMMSSQSKSFVLSLGKYD